MLGKTYLEKRWEEKREKSGYFKKSGRFMELCGCDPGLGIVGRKTTSSS